MKCRVRPVGLETRGVSAVWGVKLNHGHFDEIGFSNIA